jgi:lysyl-tRNA synthetase class II
VHEYLHSYLSPEKKVLDAKYYEIAKFFHQEIIPRRLQEERFEISYYDTYIQDKSYKNLVRYYETNKARTFTDKYFNYFLKDGIKTNPFGGISIPAAISKDAAKRMEGMPNKTIQELRQENQTDCIKKIITGFMCINKIQDSEKSFTDLNIEE